VINGIRKSGVGDNWSDKMPILFPVFPELRYRSPNCRQPSQRHGPIDPKDDRGWGVLFNTIKFVLPAVKVFARNLGDAPLISSKGF